MYSKGTAVKLFNTILGNVHGLTEREWGSLWIKANYIWDYLDHLPSELKQRLIYMKHKVCPCDQYQFVISTRELDSISFGHCIWSFNIILKSVWHSSVLQAVSHLKVFYENVQSIKTWLLHPHSKSVVIVVKLKGQVRCGLIIFCVRYTPSMSSIVGLRRIISTKIM